MPKKEQKPAYMFDNAQELEAERLRICNESHNPYSLRFLEPFIADLSKHSQVMEIGCGGGELAAAVAKKLPEGSVFHLIDRSSEQLERTQCAMAGAPSAVTIKAHQLDLVGDADKIRRIGKMDLIYCRWVICHIPEPDRVEAIAAILWSLKPGGVFVLEDGDNSSVQYHTKDGSGLPEHALEAQKRFRETSEEICRFAKIDIQYNADKQKRGIQQAQERGMLGGVVTSLGQYRLTLCGQAEKRLLSTPWRTAMSMIFHAKGIENPTREQAEEFVGPADACDADDNIKADFLTQAATAYRAPVLSRL